MKTAAISYSCLAAVTAQCVGAKRKTGIWAWRDAIGSVESSWQLLKEALLRLVLFSGLMRDLGDGQSARSASSRMFPLNIDCSSD